MIVPTTGRDTLAATVASIEPQLRQGDELIVIHAPYTGDFGNRSRDQGCQQASGEMLLFCDDDDTYTDDALDTVRRETAGQLNRVHLFRMNSRVDGVIWTDPVVRLGNVGTPMFVIPNVDFLPSWQNSEGPFSDYRFLTDTLKAFGSDPVFHPEVIAVIG